MARRAATLRQSRSPFRHLNQAMKGLAFNAGPCFFSSNIFSTLQVLSSLFFQIRNHFFNDITSGICGPYAGYRNGDRLGFLHRYRNAERKNWKVEVSNILLTTFSLAETGEAFYSVVRDCRMFSSIRTSIRVPLVSCWRRALRVGVPVLRPTRLVQCTER